MQELLDKVTNKEGTWYQVRWAGGDPDSDSWLNQKDLGGCAELMAEYSKKGKS